MVEHVSQCLESEKLCLDMARSGLAAAHEMFKFTRSEDPGRVNELLPKRIVIITIIYIYIYIIITNATTTTTTTTIIIIIIIIGIILAQDGQLTELPARASMDKYSAALFETGDLFYFQCSISYHDITRCNMI